MEEIDITDQLEDFHRHLDEDGLERTIFSAKFGDGKTVFLQKFKEKYSDVYDFYTIYPVNYQIAPNEKIMEYIKRDLLFQLILNKKITAECVIPDSVLFNWFLSKNEMSFLNDLASIAPSIVASDNSLSLVLGIGLELAKSIKKQCEKFKIFKKDMNSQDDFSKAADFIEHLSNGKGNIYEQDLITYLIVEALSKSKKKSVLIIEDLDRIDPAHLFRILNVFSAHIDRHYLCSNYSVDRKGEEKFLDQMTNKFGFDKVVFVMDADSTKNIFTHFYGDSNYKGYISKFISKHVFYYSITETAKGKLIEHLKNDCGISYQNISSKLEEMGFTIDDLSVRDIAKILDNFDQAYRTDDVRITDSFVFQSNTYLVKLLATLTRMGLRKEDIYKLIEGVETNDVLLSLLGLFAISEKSIAQNCLVYYQGEVYQFMLSIQGGYEKLDTVNPLYHDVNAKQYNFLEISVRDVIDKAFKYVN